MIITENKANIDVRHWEYVQNMWLGGKKLNCMMA